MITCTGWMYHAVCLQALRHHLQTPAACMALCHWLDVPCRVSSSFASPFTDACMAWYYWLMCIINNKLSSTQTSIKSRQMATEPIIPCTTILQYIKTKFTTDVKGRYLLVFSALCYQYQNTTNRSNCTTVAVFMTSRSSRTCTSPE